jgi:hypothetical protein
VRIYLFGYADGDAFGRVMVADTNQTVGRLAAQLQAWASELSPPTAEPLMVNNEDGDLLDAASTLTEVGLGAGDLFRVFPVGKFDKNRLAE